MSDPAHDLARFARDLASADIPLEARKLATDAITDCVACSLGGSQTELASALLNVVGNSDAPDRSASLLGTNRRASLCDAALYNGAIAHVLDYDDISHPAYSHPSAVLVPAIFSVAEATRATGAEIVAAYVVGLETFGRLGRALNVQHYKNGWHPTSTFGSLAAALAAGRLLKLSELEMRMALAMAASAAGGLRANFGTMTKALHAGYAARNGVLAALLAQQGMTAAEDSLLHKFGFAHAFNHGQGIDTAALRPRVAALEILTEFGIALKAFPSCAATHTAVEAALILRARLADRLGDISSIRVGVSEFALEPLIYIKPATPLEGKFSMHYCVAAALAEGALGLTSFGERGINDPTVESLIAKTRMEVDERVRDDREFASVVTIETKQGERMEHMVRIALGKRARWLSADQLKAKLFDCCQYSGAQVDRDALFAALQGIDSARSLDGILQLLKPHARQ